MPTSEWATRKQLIDSMLAAAGWSVVPFDAGNPLAYRRRQMLVAMATGTGNTFMIVNELLARVAREKMTTKAGRNNC
jgi:type I site-specific restriction endonuclease